MSKLRAIIVDDARLGRQKIRAMLAGHDDISVVAECANGAEAAAEIRKQEPDLVFLDIQMPGGDGFDVIKKLRRGELPAIVFVTAHDEYALRAFDVNAVDYLLKPFDRRRFGETLRRVRQRIERSVMEAQRQETHWSRFIAKSHGRLVFVPAADVDWIEAEGKYVRLHAGGVTHLLRLAIHEVEERLDPAEFARIHRGTIVNLKKVAEMYRGFGGDYVVVLRSGEKLMLSRRYWSKLKGVGGLT